MINQDFLRITEKRLIKVVDEKNSVLLTLDVLHQREELTCCTDELFIAKKFINLGWLKKRVLSKIILLSPEIQLVDLSNPIKSDYFSKNKKEGFKKLLALFLTIKYFESSGELNKIINNFYKETFFVLGGDTLELEVRVALFKKDDSLRKKIIKNIENSKKYKEILEDLRYRLGEKERKLDIFCKPIKKTNKFEQIIDLYKSTMDKDFDFPDNVYGFGKFLPEADYYLIIPHSGFKFIDEISQKIGIDRVLIYEKHFSKDGDFWVIKRNLNKKNVFIFDVSYSGKTMSWVADIVKEEGGNPFKIAVWPKSWMAVNGAEYIMFLDRIINRENINLGDKNWALNLYYKIAFNKKYDNQQ